MIFVTNVIKDFLETDDKKIEQLIAEYPVSIPTQAAAKFLGINAASMRAVIDSGAVGLSWRKDGALNKGFFLPTAQFLRWYMRYGD